MLEALGALADLLVEAAQEWIKALSHAAHVDKPSGMGAQEDVRDFLTAIDALLALEHRADDAERALTYAAVQKARDFRQLHIYSNMAQQPGRSVRRVEVGRSDCARLSARQRAGRLRSRS